MESSFEKTLKKLNLESLRILKIHFSYLFQYLQRCFKGFSLLEIDFRELLMKSFYQTNAEIVGFH